MLGNSNASLIKRNFPVIIAFIIPVLILSVIFIFNGVFPFGDEMYLRSDMYHQYAPFMKMFQRTLQEGGSLYYTWDIGLGTNVLSTYAYYLASPLNWIVVLFPGNIVPAVMDAFIVFKCGLMSATLTYYLIKHFKRISYFAPAFGIFYGLSAYMAAFSWNLMWLDCLVLLPLIILGLEKLVRERKVVLYTITLTIAIISNYYIAIMIAIFLVLYFIYLMICDRGNDILNINKVKSVFSGIGRFVWYSALSGFMAMAVLLPAIYALSQTASGEFKFPSSISTYNNILELLSKGTILTETSIFSGYFPNIYAGTMLFILVPLFWVNMKINLKRKIGITLLLAVFVVSFNTNVLTYIWHGFHYPNSLPCRQAFIFVVLALTLGYEAMIRYKQYSELQIMLVGGWAILGNVLFYIMFHDDDFTLLSGLVSVGFIIVYTLLMLFLKNKKLGLGMLTIIFLALCTGEAAFNTAYTGYSTSSYKNYVKDNEALEKLIASADNNDFHRFEKTDRRTKNDGTWVDYKSASVFSSTSLAGLSDFYDAFGMQASMNAFSYYGHTPLSTALLGVKYEFSKDTIEDDVLMSLEGSEVYGEEDEMYLYRNKYALGLGFAVDKYDEENIDMESDNPFVVQNEFASEMTGKGPLFNVQNRPVEGEIASGAFDAGGRGFIFIKDKVEEANIKITRGAIDISEDDHSDLENPQIIDLGDVEAGDKITITAKDEDDEAVEVSVILATMNYDALEDIYYALAEEQLEISEFKDDYVSGTINIKEGKKLFTTIPADNGWSVTVDGVKTEHGSFADAFITLDLEPGEHEVEFRFTVPGRDLGLVLSVLALVMFILSLIIRRNRNIKLTEEMYRKKEPLYADIVDGVEDIRAKEEDGSVYEKHEDDLPHELVIRSVTDITKKVVIDEDNS